MGWFILKYIFFTFLAILHIGRLSNQEKDLEILILRQQLSILQRKLSHPIKPNRVEKMTLAVLTAKLKQVFHQSTNPHHHTTNILRILSSRQCAH